MNYVILFVQRGHPKYPGLEFLPISPIIDQASSNRLPTYRKINLISTFRGIHLREFYSPWIQNALGAKIYPMTYQEGVRGLHLVAARYIQPTTNFFLERA